MRTYTFRPVTECDMCGSTRFRLMGLRMNGRQGLRPKAAQGVSVSVKRCRDCGLVFSDPQPVPQNLSDHYGIPPEEYWGTEDVDAPPGYIPPEIVAAKRMLKPISGMSALDVGAGVGKGMVAMTAAGFDAWGLEPSEPFYRRALRRVDQGRLQLATVEDVDYPPESFDFINFGAVLEHLYSPRQALDRAMRWLRPGGIIHAEVPSADYMISRLLNAYFRLCGTNFVTHLSPMHAPFHLFEFTRKSFEQRYKVADCQYYVCDIIDIPRALHPPLKWWMDRTNTGMEMVLYLTR